MIRLECREAERDELIAELSGRGTLGIVEQDLGGDGVALQAFFDADLDLGPLEARVVERDTAEERDWVTETRNSYSPLLIGEKFFLVPAWLTEATPAGRFRLPTRPGMACGTGYHEATQLCLEEMEHLVRPSCTFVDIGVGTGLLCVAASLLGAERMIGCDIDPDAVAVAQENLEQDGVSAQLLTGSTDALPDALADVLVANISAPAHLELAREYARLLRLEGVGLISGFEEYEEETVLAALTTAGLRLAGRRERNHWLCQLVSR